MGNITGQAHHIIPLQLIRDNKYVKKLYEGGWNINKALNGVALPAGFHGKHSAYTEWVDGIINSFVSSNGEKGLQEFIEKTLIPNAKTLILEMEKAYQSNPNVGNLNTQMKNLIGK